MTEYVYIGARMNVSLPPVFRKWIVSEVFRLQWLMRQRFDSVDERPGCTDLAQE
jgi:hypothetical protein